MLSLRIPALLIIDMQNGFCHPNGTFGKLAMLAKPNHHLAIVPKINELRAAANKAGVPIFFIRLALREDYTNAGVQWDDLQAMKDLKGFVKDSWDAKNLDELTPDPKNANEIDWPKTRNTAFYETGLEEKLRRRDVDQLIVTGVGTNVCVESTVRDAVARGFHVKTVSDATATLTVEEHEASLKTLDTYYGGVVEGVEVIHALKERAVSDEIP